MPLYLTHYFLVAMPSMVDAYFTDAVLYVIEHDDKGAAAIIVNKTLPIFEQQLIQQTGIEARLELRRSVRYGGPVAQEQAFILYRPQIGFSANLNSNILGLSSQIEDLTTIALGQGPEDYALCLGYAGWGPQQLEQEIQQNDWLILPATKELLWHKDYEQLRQRCLQALNINPAFLPKTTGKT